MVIGLSRFSTSSVRSGKLLFVTCVMNVSILSDFSYLRHKVTINFLTGASVMFPFSVLRLVMTTACLPPPPPSFSVPPSRLSPPLFTFLDQSYQELSTEFIFSKHLLVAFRVLSIICLFSGSLISCLYYFFNFAFFDLSCCFFPDLRASRRCLRRAGGEATASQPARQAAALGAAPWR